MTPLGIFIAATVPAIVVIGSFVIFSRIARGEPWNEFRLEHHPTKGWRILGPWRESRVCFKCSTRASLRRMELRGMYFHNGQMAVRICHKCSSPTEKNALSRRVNLGWEVKKRDLKIRDYRPDGEKRP